MLLSHFFQSLPNRATGATGAALDWAHSSSRQACASSSLFLLLNPSAASHLLLRLLSNVILSHLVALLSNHTMSTYTLKSLGNDYLEDSSILPESSVPAEQDQSSFKLVGLKDQNAAKQSMLRISHKRHADPSTRIDTKSRVMGTMSPAVAPEAAKEQPEERAAAGQRMGENRDPADRLPNETWANRRNPVTGQGLTPAEPMHGGRTHNMRNKSSITFITSPE